MDYKNDPGRWSLTDLFELVENSDGDGALCVHLRDIAETLERDGSPNFILGKVIIINDLDKGADEPEESDDDGGDDE